jgi:hypothetical protein
MIHKSEYLLKAVTKVPRVMDEGIINFLLKMNFIVLFLFWEGLFLVLPQLITFTKEREIL